MEIPGFYFCLCPDSTLAREHVADLRLQWAQSGIVMESQIFWADDGLDDRFWEALTVQGLTRTPKILLVRGAQGLSAEIWRQLSSTLASPRPGILAVFFMEGAWEKGQPKLPAHISKLRCLEFAEKKNWTWRAPGLEPRTMRRHIQTKVKAMGLSLAPGVLEELCGALAPDAAGVHNVLEQLALASRDGAVDAALVRQMTAHTPEVIIFDFIRHLQTGNTAKVWKTLLSEGDGGESMLFPLLALLAREARLLWQVQAGENVYLPQHIAGAKRALATKLGTGGLGRVFRVLMEAEWAVKSGRRQPLQALEELVAELTHVFRPENMSGRPEALFSGADIPGTLFGEA